MAQLLKHLLNQGKDQLEFGSPEPVHVSAKWANSPSSSPGTISVYPRGFLFPRDHGRECAELDKISKTIKFPWEKPHLQ